ncbi:MAG: inositol monophosphatase family protein, partial [Alphaproteobacteria bacterium]
MSPPCPEEFVRFAEELAEASGPVLRRHFRTRIPVEAKADMSPVTIADREAEEALRAAIAARYPDHGIVGEEYPPHAPDAELVWVLDPIDGTRSFISGAPVFGTLIALVARDRPILGVIDQPILGERWIGADGLATRMNGRPARTRARTDLGEAALHTTSPDLFAGADADAFAGLRGAVQRTDYGWDCYAYAQLASGFIDLVVEVGL